jgi:hypothetical protein
MIFRALIDEDLVKCKEYFCHISQVAVDSYGADPVLTITDKDIIEMSQKFREDMGK